MSRPHLQSRHPLHVTVRLRDGWPNLRSPLSFSAVHKCIRRASEFGLRVVHFSVLSNHIHMIVEVTGKKGLVSGMRSFNSRLARHLRRATNEASIGSPSQSRRTLKVKLNSSQGLFKGRYNIQILNSPKRVKQALKYVLLNPCRHFKKAPYVDAYASSAGFEQWRKLMPGGRVQVHLSKNFLNHLIGQLRETLHPPREWLLTTGWLRA